MLSKISFFILSFFCFFSCFQKDPELHFTQNEKEQCEELFKNLFLAETGIYTLFGSKAMTVISLDLLSDETGSPSEEGYYNMEIEYSLLDSWKLWEKKLPDLPIQNFLFFTKKTEGIDGGVDGFFVNLKKTRHILQKHYDVFEEQTGMEFNIDAVLQELGSESSTFWSRVFKTRSHITKGLLFGVEKENAIRFNELDPEEIEGEMSDHLLPYDEITIENFTIPFFRSFDEDDPMISMYYLERERIQDYFKQVPFFEGVLQKLAE